MTTYLRKITIPGMIIAIEVRLGGQAGTSKFLRGILMKIFSLVVFFALSGASLFSVPESPTILNPFPTFCSGYRSCIETTIKYAREDEESGDLRPCKATISIDGSKIEVYHEKPCSPELLAALQKDYKLVITQAISARNQAFQNVLAAYRDDAARGALASEENYYWEAAFYKKLFDAQQAEAFKNSVVRDFFETFEATVGELHNVEDFPEEMSSISPVPSTLAQGLKIFEYQLQREDIHRLIQTAYEVYMLTFVVPGSGIVVSMNQPGDKSPVKMTIHYVSQDPQGSDALSPCQALISIDGSEIGVYNEKPCSPELLAALQKDHKLVIAQAMSAKKQADTRVLVAYAADAVRLAPAHEESDLYDEFGEKAYGITEEELSKNPVVKDFFETFVERTFLLHNARGLSTKINPALRTLAGEMECFAYQVKHEDIYHHIQKAFEVYISTFLGRKN